MAVSTEETFAQGFDSTVAQLELHRTDPVLALLVPLDTMYYAVHITAICVQVISIFCSAFVIFWQGRRSKWQSFWKRRMSERLVIYLAVNDLVYSISHCGDHIMVMAASGRVILAEACNFFGGILTEIVCAQTIMVFLQAFNAVVVVTFNKHIKYGKYDVGFLILSYGVPVPVIILFIVQEYFGYSDYWCFMDALNPKAWSMGQTFGVVHSITSVVILLLYSALVGLAWKSYRAIKKFVKYQDDAPVKIVSDVASNASTSCSDQPKSDFTSLSPTSEFESSQKKESLQIQTPLPEQENDVETSSSVDNPEPEINQESKTSSNKAENAKKKLPVKAGKSSNALKARNVRIMKVSSLFVLAYVAQWWPSIVFYGIAPFANDSGQWYVMTLAIFANAGGLFNMLAYSTLRSLIIEK